MLEFEYDLGFFGVVLFKAAIDSIDVSFDFALYPRPGIWVRAYANRYVFDLWLCGPNLKRRDKNELQVGSGVRQKSQSSSYVPE